MLFKGDAIERLNRALWRRNYPPLMRGGITIKLKKTNKERPALLIALQLAAFLENRVKVSVADTGAGISPGRLAQMNLQAAEKYMMLTAREFSVLLYLLKNEGRMLPAKEIYEGAWSQPMPAPCGNASPG